MVDEIMIENLHDGVDDEIALEFFKPELVDMKDKCHNGF
jgi:hypothetical protein